MNTRSRPRSRGGMGPMHSGSNCGNAVCMRVRVSPCACEADCACVRACVRGCLCLCACVRSCARACVRPCKRASARCAVEHGNCHRGQKFPNLSGLPGRLVCSSLFGMLVSLVATTCCDTCWCRYRPVPVPPIGRGRDHGGISSVHFYERPLLGTGFTWVGCWLLLSC
jgi:hypothetical protein